MGKKTKYFLHLYVRIYSIYIYMCGNSMTCAYLSQLTRKYCKIVNVKVANSVTFILLCR